MRYQQVVETIKERLDIVDVVSEHVNLKRQGRNFVGLCPFHSEKTPSFTVSPEKQMFYCFGCGAGGDVITFWMKIESLDFADAVKDLADRLGIEIPQGGEARNSKWEMFHAINRAVAAYYQRLLHETPPGKAALAYLKRRGLSLETIKTFELGFAPPGIYPLSTYLEEQGIDVTEAFSIGILKKGKDGRFLPIFRNRIIFPIVDERGRTVGFGGRALGDTRPKYLNTPDSLIFQKGKLFYGEALTKREIVKDRKAVLVEGYLDLIALYQLGIPNGIAALGTAFTDFHAKRLKRWADTVVLVFDGDEAGRKASSRALEKLLQVGILVYEARLPENKDPGDYLVSSGGEELKGIIASSEDALITRFRVASQEGDGVQDQERRIKRCLNLLRMIQDPVMLDLYIRKASDILGLKKDILYGILKNSEDSGKKAIYPFRSKSGDGRRGSFLASGKPTLPGKRMEEAEEVLLAALWRCPDLAEEMAERDALGLFQDAALKRIGSVLLDEVARHGDIDGKRLLLRLDGEQQALISRLAVSAEPLEGSQARQAFWDALKVLMRRNYQLRIEELDSRIRASEKDNDFKELKALLEKRKALTKRYQDMFNTKHAR